MASTEPDDIIDSLLERFKRCTSEIADIHFNIRLRYGVHGDYDSTHTYLKLDNKDDYLIQEDFLYGLTPQNKPKYHVFLVESLLLPPEKEIYILPTKNCGIMI